MDINKLSPDQKNTRRRIIEISYKRKICHLGSNLSSIDLIDAIYKVKKKNEKFILSNGHAAIALYVILEKNGLLDVSKINKLHLHPDRNSLDKIDVSTGSLGQGLPIALGMALADRDKNVFCTISDGECSEGSIWETFRIAEEQNANNFKVIINANGWGAYKNISLQRLKKRIKSFDWNIIETDGHNIEKLTESLIVNTADKPLLIFAKTEVKQLPFLKGLDAHYKVMSKKEYNQAMKILK